MPKHIIIISLMLFSFLNKANAQRTHSNEIGIITGPVAFKSDYGQRFDFKTNANNNGFGIGLVYYMSFSYIGYNNFRAYDYFNEHFKLRAEVSYSKSELRHYGKYVDTPSNSLGVQQLRAMRGSTELINLGAQLEYYIFDVHEFESTDGGFDPFLSFGAQYSAYNPRAYSLLGPLNNSATTYPKYMGATSNQDGNVFSLTGSIGTRFKLNSMSDLMLDLRGQYYFSDWVDGLNPDKNKYTENRYNDWLVWLNVGYILYIEDH